MKVEIQSAQDCNISRRKKLVNNTNFKLFVPRFVLYQNKLFCSSFEVKFFLASSSQKARKVDTAVLVLVLSFECFWSDITTKLIYSLFYFRMFIYALIHESKAVFCV